MNIFLTSDNPTSCATALDNRRLVKMVLETAQLVSTTCNVLVPTHTSSSLYRTTHQNHPCALFPRRSFANFEWLVEHGIALADEYSHRYGKIHASKDVITAAYDTLSKGKIISHLPDYRERPLKFTFNCSGFKTGDVFADYRLCMLSKWAKDTPKPSWGDTRSPPDWAKEV